MEESKLTEKQKQMLEMLDITVSRNVDVKEMQEMATSDDAMDSLLSGTIDLKAYIKNKHCLRCGACKEVCPTNAIEQI